LLALLVLVLAGLGVAYFLTRDDDDATTTTSTVATTTAATTTAQVTVPDVVGTTSSEATATLRNAGLDANLVSVPSDRSPGTVIAQNPSAGEEVSDGSTVRLNVAEAAKPAPTTTAPETTTAAPEPAAVPDVVGQELADAARAFSEEGLKVAVVYVPSNEPAGSVVAQARPPGAELQPGDTVQLNVSTGAEPAPDVQVPDVTGEKQAGGRDQLKSAGFEVLTLEEQTDDRSRVGSVLSQTPSGGANIPRGSLVLLYVGA
jgi:serine/threonine-protein kinase